MLINLAQYIKTNLDHSGKYQVPQFGLDICVSLSVYEMHKAKVSGFLDVFFHNFGFSCP